MSGLPIISPLNSAPLSLRDTSAALIAAPPKGTAAVVRTTTANAVQQARTLDATDAIPRKPMPMEHEKRGRLIGPPPTFEVNILQHLQETRMLPDDTPPPTRTGTDLDILTDDNSGDRATQNDRGNTDTLPAEIRAQKSAYDALERISPSDKTNVASAMNISI